MGKLLKIRFTVKNNYGEVSTVDYEWNKDDGIPDQETILENMEECSCSLNESVNTCECEPEWDNGEILKVEYLNANGELAPTMGEEEIICRIWREFRGEETEPYHWGDCNQQPQPCLLCHCERIAKFLSGKLPKQPTYSEEEIYNISCRCDTRNDFVKALFGKLRQPRKVDGKKIKQLIDDCVSVGNRTELFLSIMKEIGDE